MHKTLAAESGLPRFGPVRIPSGAVFVDGQSTETHRGIDLQRRIAAVDPGHQRNEIFSGLQIPAQSLGLVDVLPALKDGDSRLLGSLLVGSRCLRCP